jgi:hypothetical protein
VLDRALVAAADQVAARIDAAMRGDIGAEVIEMPKPGVQARRG